MMSKIKDNLIYSIVVTDFGFEKILLQKIDEWFPFEYFGAYIKEVEFILSEMDFDTLNCEILPSILVDYEIDRITGGDSSPVEFDRVFGKIGCNLESVDEFINWWKEGHLPSEVCSSDSWEGAKAILEEYLTSGNKAVGCELLYSLYGEFMENYVWTKKSR